jgi:hypothetical protein
MITEDFYNDVVQSLMKFCKDIAEEAQQDGLSNTLRLHDWEAHAVEPELPEGDLIGPGAIGVEIGADKIVTVQFAVGISSEMDVSMFRLRKIISRVFSRLQPETRLKLYSHAAAEPRSWMVVTAPVHAEPVTRSEQRVYQFVSVRALIDPKAA